MDLGKYPFCEAIKIVSQYRNLDKNGIIELPEEQRMFLNWKTNDKLLIVLDIDNKCLIVKKEV